MFQRLQSITLTTNANCYNVLFSLLQIDFFEDMGVKTLNYLDSLFQWDKLQKSQFYKGLPPIIQKFPHRVCLNRYFICLLKPENLVTLLSTYSMLRVMEVLGLLFLSVARIERYRMCAVKN